MEINRVLKQINLSNNYITDNGAMELMQILESNKITSEIIIDFTELESENTSYEVEVLLTKALDIHNKKLGKLSMV
ncbi:MAG: hypothetical protein LN563_01940 [Rickettsia endosymbiont of Platyusa sonomae]|nr:hypothetical protein [Rickettsia endosymbiont of Platyusa sonomae]